MLSSMCRCVAAFALMLHVVVPIALASSPWAADGPFATEVRGLVAEERFSGVVLMAVPKAEPWVMAAGFADHAMKRPITRDTVFNMASMTKMFTAVAIGQLLEAGKIALDDPVAKHLPQLKAPWAETVTLKHLLTHTSGLGDFSHERAGTLRNARDWLEVVSTVEPSAKPGETFIYSNTGFVTLGLVVAAASGQSYADYIQEHIWKPAGMTHTYFVVGEAEAAKIEGIAQGFTRGPAGKAKGAAPVRRAPGEELPPRRPAWLVPQSGPAGGTYTTADDMLRFGRALQTNPLLKRATRELLFAPQISPGNERAAPGVKRQYALGFGVTEVHGRRFVGHNGGAPGVSTQFYLGDDGTVLVILGNEDMAIMPVLRAFHEALAK